MKPYHFKPLLAKCGLFAIVLCLLVCPTLRSAAAPMDDVNAAMIAANHRGDIKTVQALLERGADPNAHDRQGRTALMDALLFGNYHAVAFWERQDQDLSVRDVDGTTLLMYAAKSPDPDAVTFLLDHGAEVDARDRLGRTALMATVLQSNPQADVILQETPYVEVAERLLARGANVNAQDQMGRTPLMYAAVRDRLQSLQSLLQHGADVHQRDHLGRTALAWAATGGTENEIVRVLREHGAVVTFLDFVLWEDHARVQTLLSGKVDLTERDASGATALMVAAE